MMNTFSQGLNRQLATTKWITSVPFICVAAAILAVLLVGSEFWISTLTFAAIYGIAAVGLNIVSGFAGQMSFGTTMFMALGGYLSAILTTRYDVNAWLALALGAAIAAGLAFVIGVPVMRLKAHYFGLATFGMALSAVSVTTGATVTGGPSGIVGVPGLPGGALRLEDPRHYYVFVWAVLAGCALVASRVRISRTGRAWSAIASREDVAASLGVRVRSYKVKAFVVSAILGALAGSLYVHFTSFVAPDVFNVDAAIQIFAMVYIGGLATVTGPLIGTLLVVSLPALSYGLQDWSQIGIQLLLLVILVVAPKGLAQAGQLLVPRQSARPRTRTMAGGEI